MVGLRHAESSATLWLTDDHLVLCQKRLLHYGYKTVPHITLKSIAQNEPADNETLYDQPEIDRSAVRVAGPFTVEAVQPPLLDPDSVDTAAPASAHAVSSYLDQMIESLRRGGLTVRGQHMAITQISPLVGGTLHAEADYEQAGKTVHAAVVFGPQCGPMISGQLQDALNEARGTYDALITAAFVFDDQAHGLMQKATLRPPVLGVAINADLLMGNLLKTSKASQVFSVFGKPDVQISPPSPDGYTVTVKGVDIYDPNTGEFDASTALHKKIIDLPTEDGEVRREALRNHFSDFVINGGLD